MVTRRNVLIGFGAVAAGSGTLALQAAFSDSVSPGADFRIVAAGDLRVRAGESFGESGPSWASESESINWAELSPGDLPKAAANEEDNSTLAIDLARLNDSSTVEFPDLIEIENQGSTTEKVGINYDGGYAIDGTEDWTEATPSYGSGSEEIGYDDIQEIFQFKASADDLNALEAYDSQLDQFISPNPGDDTESPRFFIELAPGETIQLELVTELTADQVTTFAQAADVGQPFSDAPDGEAFQLLETITVGTESTT